MIALITAALVAAEPAQMADPHAQMAPMNQQQHEAMKGKCCCEDMAKGGHDHAPHANPRDHGGK